MPNRAAGLNTQLILAWMSISIVRHLVSDWQGQIREGKMVEQRINGAPVLVSQDFTLPAANALIAARYDNG